MDENTIFLLLARSGRATWGEVDHDAFVGYGCAAIAGKQGSMRYMERLERDGNDRGFVKRMGERRERSRD